jgi:subtilase family serine protease
VKEIKASFAVVCAFDVTARADASNQVAEADEGNNSVTRRFYREVPLQ